MRLMNSPMMCDDAPLPTDAYDSGLALPALSRSSTVLYGELPATDQHVLRAREHRDRRHVLDEVVRQLGEQRLVGAVRLAVADRQRVAVGRGRDALAGADRARCARLVLDDDGLAAPHRRHLLRDQARDDVGGAAGRERDDQLTGRSGYVALRDQRATANSSQSSGSRSCESSLHGNFVLSRE